MRIVSYLRVSTKHQGFDGLGIDAQRSAVSTYCERNDATLVSEFVEVESGKKSNRPQLLNAIDLCKKQQCVLVVSKLDRLSRSLAFTCALLDSGLEFICLDNPNVDKFTISLLALLAQEEQARTSKRTKEALKASRARGTLPRIPSTQETLRAQAASVQVAREYAATVKPLALRKREAGKTLQEISDFLNGRGIKTRRGGLWRPCSVKLLLER